MYNRLCWKFYRCFKTKQIALSQYERGADIIFTGVTTGAVIDAAKEKGSYFYGLNNNAPLNSIIDAYFEKDEVIL